MYYAIKVVFAEFANSANISTFRLRGNFTNHFHYLLSYSPLAYTYKKSKQINGCLQVIGKAFDAGLQYLSLTVYVHLNHAYLLLRFANHKFLKGSHVTE